MPRSFIAIESNEKVRKSLRSVQTDLERTGADLKIVSPENIHLTLRFLGNVSESRIELVEDAINTIETVGSFELRVKDLGVFPKPEFIRVIWAGVLEGADEVKYLQEQLNQNLAKVGFSPDDKEFTPHFTIARVKSGKAKDKLISQIKKRADEDFGSIYVEEMKLKKSKLTPEGPVYSTLSTVSFD